MGKRKYKPKANPTTPTLFIDHAHRLPEAGEPMAYAMACVEVVANWSPRGRELYRALVEAWAAPGAKAFYEQFIATMPEEQVAQWKEWMKHPELLLLPDPNKPLRDLVEVGPSLQSVPGTEEIVKALEGAESTPEVTDTAQLVGLVLAFILEGFNREQDLERGIIRVLPTTEPPWLMFMTLYRSGLEYGGITLERLDRIYKVRQLKGKTVNFAEVMANDPMGRLHRQVVKASKEVGLKLHHDNTFLDAAWVWYQCRVVHSSIDAFLDAAWKEEEDFRLEYKYAQKLVQQCDNAIGYRKRLARPST